MKEQNTIAWLFCSAVRKIAKSVVHYSEHTYWKQPTTKLESLTCEASIEGRDETGRKLFLSISYSMASVSSSSVTMLVRCAYENEVPKSYHIPVSVHQDLMDVGASIASEMQL